MGLGARGRTLLIHALIVAATLFVYAQVSGFDFVGLDDHSYITENPHVLAGLASSSVAWAWTTTTETHWAPLTWMSFMLDQELGGGSPRVFHLTNLALHLLNASILFTLLAWMTGYAWRSALVALLFAIHPLHVESVAWITERKDVLSGLFFFLAIGAYIAYTEKPGPLRYAAVAVAYVLGLLSKSMVVTLPVVLLILDYWPLRRLGVRAEMHDPKSGRPPRAGLGRLLLEKAPLALCSVPIAWIAYHGQVSSGTLGSLEQFPMSLRAANAVVSAATYLWQTIWPSGLAVPYPYWPESLTSLKILAAVLVCGAISAAALWFGRSRPWLLMGWLWYVVTLLPVSGLVQAGAQSRADRYTYLPLIGIFLIAAWGAAEALAPILATRPRARAVAAAGATIVVVAFAAAARVQAAHWRTSESLFARALLVTDRNAIAHNGMGLELYERGEVEKALEHYLTSLSYWPSYAEAHVNAAVALVRLGRSAEAVPHYEAADRLRPPDPRVLVRLGAALLDSGEAEKAVGPLTRAARLAPDDANVSEQLGAALARAGRKEEALEPLRAAVRARPDSALVRVNLGIDLASLGRLDEAETVLREAVRLAPADAGARKTLGVVQARLGRLDEAGASFEEAARLDPSDEGIRKNLERVRGMQAAPR